MMIDDARTRVGPHGLDPKGGDQKAEMKAGSPWRLPRAKKGAPAPTEKAGHCTCKNDLRAFLKCLKAHPLFGDLVCHKPKQTFEHRVARLAQDLAAPSTLAPVLIHLYKKYESGQPPGNDFEAAAFAGLDRMPSGTRDGMKGVVAKFDSLPKSLRARVFNSKYVDFPFRNPIDIIELRKEVIRELLAYARREEYPYGGPIVLTAGSLPGFVRPQVIGGPGNEFYPEAVSVVIPTICTINGVLQQGYRPEPERWPDESLMRRCGSQPDGTILCTDYVTAPGCLAGQTSASSAPPNVCLRTPVAQVGSTVTLTGFNFISTETKVRLTRADNPGYQLLLGVIVVGDITQPPDIADCRVQDTINLDIPSIGPDGAELRPGDYTLKLLVPNAGGVYRDLETIYAPMGPEVLSSRPHRLHITPRSGATYEISLDQVFCSEMTDGIDSDEVLLRFLVAGTSSGSSGRMLIRYPSPPDWRNEDVDSGEAFPGERVIFRDVFPDLLAISVLGYEVDSEEMLQEGLDSFGEAYVQWWEDVIESINIEDEIQVTLEIVIAFAFIAAVVAIVGLFYAAWAPPDPIINDGIVIPAELMYYLTDSTAPMMEPTSLGSSNGIEVDVFPELKRGSEYFEWRRYRSKDEDSWYFLRIRYARVA